MQCSANSDVASDEPADQESHTAGPHPWQGPVLCSQGMASSSAQDIANLPLKDTRTLRRGWLSVVGRESDCPWFPEGSDHGRVAQGTHGNLKDEGPGPESCLVGRVRQRFGGTSKVMPSVFGCEANTPPPPPPPPPPPNAPLHPWIWLSRPWQRIHIDFAGPFMDKSFFIVVDAHSKWAEVVEMPQSTTARTIAVLRHLFATHGIPEQIVSDNGPQFTSNDFAEFTKTNGIKHTRSSPYHPATNGEAEKWHQAHPIFTIPPSDEW